VTTTVAITGVGMELPGIPRPLDLWSATACKPAPDAFRPEAVLGKKGLFGKDRATRLALCAAKKTLDDSNHAGSNGETGVVVSCSLGNLDTVGKAVQTISAGHVRDLSPMDLPNASSNVIASSIAVRFGCRALNVAVCGGSDSGIQAVGLAAMAIAAGRAERVLVIGVEARTEASEALLLQSLRRWLGEDVVCPLLEGAAGLLLEAPESAAQRKAPIYATLAHGPLRQSRELAAASLEIIEPRAWPDLWLTPNGRHAPIKSQVESLCHRWRLPRERLFDLGARFGESYGLAGVLQSAAGCLWLRDRGGVALATSGGVCGESFSGLLLSSPPAG
jgi:3-oxoacyl-[acyl-carrier-protein] synthase II